MVYNNASTRLSYFSYFNMNRAISQQQSQISKKADTEKDSDIKRLLRVSLFILTIAFFYSPV